MSAPLQVPGRAPVCPRQRLWRVLRWCHTPRTLGELFAAAHIAPGLFFQLTDRWQADGHLLLDTRPVRLLMTDRARKRLRAPADPHAAPARWVPPRSGRARMWSAMRVLKTFDDVSLAMAAEVSQRSIDEFVRGLIATGYVKPVPSESRRASYKLVRDTGPKHPVIRRSVTGTLAITNATDRNDGRLHQSASGFPSPHNPRLRAGERG